MRNLTHESPSNNFEVIEGGRALQQNARQVSRESAYEERIEDRFRHLTGDIQHFVSSLQAARLADYSPAREILHELAAKLGKLAWKIGVARRSEGAARHRLWPDVERSLGDLEATLSLLSRLQFVDGHWSVRRSAVPFHSATGGLSGQAEESPYDDIS
jgi:hypothetical protein